MVTDRAAINALSYRVIGCAIAVHRELGPGLLERTYVLAMAEELNLEGIVRRLDVPAPVLYRGKSLGCGYRMDILVADTIVLELKSVNGTADIHHKQLMSYLKIAKLPLGLLINFNVSLLRDGITRIINLPRNNADQSQSNQVVDVLEQPARRAPRGGRE